MCLGAQAKAANANAKRRYAYENERRERSWMQTMSIYNAQKSQYEADVDNAGLAQAFANTEMQLAQNKARDEAQQKYQDMYIDLLQNTDYGKMMASGQTGKSVQRMGVMEFAKYGRDTTDIANQVLANDFELEKEKAMQVSKYQSFKEQSFAKVAFQPVQDVPPPQPVMQNVGAAMFMDALSIGSKIAGIYTAFP